ncbi:hypothetical protein [Clostridium sp. 1001283B150210_160208_E6]|uniref:hypothetical protein n=1 Tax=Clostridium sp. 1001283B150210_160208_E6 TaxID=2787129 RepID=UPI001A9B7642|nr:hypothetical protein [Clostridium sp. 1001283B150210_160208_E6]
MVQMEVLKMCKALSYSEQLSNVINSARDDFDSLNNRLSLLDKMQQDILHKIENTNSIDLYEGWKLTKSLQEIRRERRKIKDELETMVILIRDLGHLKKTKSKVEQKETELNNRLKKTNKGYKMRVLKSTEDILIQTHSKVISVVG